MAVRLFSCLLFPKTRYQFFLSTRKKGVAFFNWKGHWSYGDFLCLVDFFGPLVANDVAKMPDDMKEFIPTGTRVSL